MKTIPAYQTERDGIHDAVFLDANESYRQWVKVDFRNAPPLNRYPDNVATHLRRKLCETHVSGFAPSQVCMASGSMELIDLILRGFCEKALLLCDPTYQVYEIKAAQSGIPVRKVLLHDDFSLDLDALRRESANADVLLLISPNNPTGSLVTRKDLETILRFS